MRTVEVPLEATGDGVRTAPAQVLEAVADAEVYCGWGIRPDVFTAARELRWFHSGAAGARNSLFPAMRESDVVMTNAAGVYAYSLADHALAGIFHFVRGLHLAVRAQAARTWAQGALNAPSSPLHAGIAGGEVSGVRLGIIGYGGIGRALGRKAAALGMRVGALRRLPHQSSGMPPELEWLGPPEELPRLLATSDIVALTAPETASTRNLLGADEIASMKEGALFINLSRGSMVDEEALIEALRTGRLGGALLDVFQSEPLPADHIFWELGNVLVTPHTGGTSARLWERQTDLIVENIKRYLDDRPLLNEVNKEWGY